MATKDPDALAPDGADQPPKRLVRTTIAGIGCLIFGGLSLLLSIWQVLALTLFGNLMGDLQAAQRAQVAELQAAQEARLMAERDAEAAALESALDVAKQAGRDAEVVQLDAKLDVVRNRPIVVAPMPGSEFLKFQEALESPGMQAWQLGAGLFYLVLYTLLIIAGIGVLQRRGWGRRLGVVTNATLIAVGVASAIIMWGAMAALGDPGQFMKSPVGVVALLSGFCGLGCSAGVPAAILLVLVTRAVREEFAHWEYHAGQ